MISERWTTYQQEKDGCMDFYKSEVLGVTIFLGDWKTMLAGGEFDGRFDLIMTSPPYNLGKSGVVQKKYGDRKNGKYDQKSFGGVHYSDCVPEDEYQQQQHDAIVALGKLLKQSGTLAYNHKNRHKNGRLISPHEWFPLNPVLHEEVVLDRRSTHNHELSFYAPTTERLYVFRQDKVRLSRFGKVQDLNVGRYFNPVPFDGTTKHERDVWYMPIVNGKKNIGHTATFDLSVANRVIHHHCPEGGIVCDPYCGAGTTMVSSVRMGRSFVGSEIDPVWFEKCVKKLRLLEDEG
ncbi:MAG: site-specific DNA-methyltransferase [Candidatus Bathyarchaeia archaeon]